MDPIFLLVIINFLLALVHLVSLLYSWKFSHIFRGCKNGILVLNGLIVELKTKRLNFWKGFWKNSRSYVMLCAIWYHLHLLKTVKNTHGGKKIILSLLHGCFSRFLNCTNGTKLRKASHIIFKSVPIKKPSSKHNLNLKVVGSD